MIPTPDGFLRSISRVEKPDVRPGPSLVRLGEVIDASPLLVLWDGDVSSDDIEHERNVDYSPVAGDRVLGLRCGKTYVVLCKIG